MTGEEFKDFCSRHNLRPCDVSWLCGYKNCRQIMNWKRDGVPMAPTLIFRAIDEGLLPIEWFRNHLDVNDIPD